jgi:hypothetical protein
MKVSVLIWSDPNRDDIVRVFKNLKRAIRQAVIISGTEQIEENPEAQLENWDYFATGREGRSVIVLTTEVE